MKTLFYFFSRYKSILISFFLTIIISGCTKNKYEFAEGIIWNTTFHITYKGKPELKDSLLKVFDSVGESLSVFDPNSLVSKVNSADSIKIDNHFRRVYETSAKINEASNGMFDPTVSPLVTAWGFGLGHQATADTARIDSLMTFVGFRKTKIENEHLIKTDSRIQFNFSAIAKGYACDQAGKMFERNNVTDYMVEIGGELCLHGKSPSNSLWRISIDTPIEETGAPDHTSFLIIELTDCGIATSGDYRNFSYNEGMKLAHTISPVTGRPALSDVLSATVVAPTCMEADAAATACMAAGLNQAESILKKLGYEALLILPDSVWMTPGFRNLISEEVSEPGKKGRN